MSQYLEGIKIDAHYGFSKLQITQNLVVVTMYYRPRATPFPVLSSRHNLACAVYTTADALRHMRISYVDRYANSVARGYFCGLGG